MPKLSLISFLAALVLTSNGQGQNQLHIQKAISSITVDAKMDEAAWQPAQVASGFRQYFPFDSSTAKVKTEVRVTYDDQFLYVYAIMHNNEPRQYVTPSLRRD